MNVGLAPEPLPALEELHALNHWCGWRWEVRGGKKTKVPKIADLPGVNAQANSPSTWRSYTAYESHAEDFDGPGFFITDTDYCALDLDRPAADHDAVDEELIAGFASYTERTPSGNRRIWIRGRKPLTAGSRASYKGRVVEIYDGRWGSARFLTVTGHQLGDVGIIEDRQDYLDQICQAMWPTPVAPSATPSTIPSSYHPDWQVWGALIEAKPIVAELRAGGLAGKPSTSEAVGKLVYELAWITQDPAQIDSMFRDSGLFGDGEDQWSAAKWDRLGTAEISHAIDAQAGRYFDWGDYSVRSKAAPAVAVEAYVAPSTVQFAAMVESGQDFRAHADDEPEMVIPSVLSSRGFALVGGGAKEGKTWALIDMMLAVANEQTFMDLGVATPGRVLYVGAEGSRAGIKSRFDMIARGKGLDPDAAMKYIDILFRKNVMLDDPAFQAYLAEIAPRYVVIVADPLIKLWGGDEDKARDVGPFTRKMTEIAERGPAFVLSHHTVKVSETSKDRNPWLNIRGSGQWYGAMDSGLYVERGKGATRSTVRFAGKDYSPAPDATFTWPRYQVNAGDTVNLDWQAVGESSTAIEGQERQAAQIVARQPGQSIREVKDQLEGTNATRQQAVWNLINRGVVEKVVTEGERSDGRKYTFEGLYIPGSTEDRG